MALLRRYEDALANRFDELQGRGFALLEWHEIYKWYGIERITKFVWKDLSNRFEDAYDGQKDRSTLWISELTSGVLLIDANSGSRNLKTISEKAGDRLVLDE
jgi:hypothetical protein